MSTRISKFPLASVRTLTYNLGMSFALFHLPEIESRISRMPIAIYRELVEKYPEYEKTELIEGVVLQKMAKSPIHSYFSQKLIKLIDRILPEDSIARLEAPLTFSHSELEPDISAVRGSLEDYRFQHPNSALLIVEISHTSLALDRQKGKIYAKAGIPEYWILDCDMLQIEVYSSPESGEYQKKNIYQKQDSIPIFGTSLDLQTLFSTP